jgi:DUF4097 and DUF4098 domain-containing protein YvlB
VHAPFCRIRAERLGDSAELITEHASVNVAKAADLIVRAPDSDVRVEDLNGDIQIYTSNSEVRVRSVSGDLKIEAEQTSVNAEEIRGYAKIATSHGEVAVRNFFEGIDVKTSFRNVSLTSAAAPSEDISVENNHGSIKLQLPESSEFRMDAVSEGGEIKPIGFPVLARSPG